MPRSDRGVHRFLIVTGVLVVIGIAIAQFAGCDVVQFSAPETAEDRRHSN